MSMFDELMNNENYRKLFEEFPDDQRPLLIERIRNFMNEAENKLINPLKDATVHVKAAIDSQNKP